MKNTSLVYIEKDDMYLMLYRNKKDKDYNKGKWIGVGGKCEENESPEDCMLREVFEETGLTALEYRFRGIVTFISDVEEGEYMYLFTVSSFSGDLISCDEGELKWIKKSEIFSLNLWEGDKEFLRLLFENAPFFTMKLMYKGDKLEETIIKSY